MGGGGILVARVGTLVGQAGSWPWATDPAEPRTLSRQAAPVAPPGDDTNPDPPDGSGPDAEGDGPDAAGRRNAAGDGPTGGSEIAPAARSQTPSVPRPEPPRRTGVFIDPQELRGHVSDLLRTIVGPHRVDPFGNFSFDHDSTRVFVTVNGSPMGPMVGVFSVTNTGLELSSDLSAWMATTNHALALGSLSWDDDNNAVWLRHNLVGSHLDVVELQAAVQAVAGTAAKLDDEIQARFGGKRFTDRSDDQQQPGEGQPPGEGMEGAGEQPPRTNTTGYL